MIDRKKKFLVSAYGCEPNKGSEPGIGWQWCLQFARFGEVHIITRSNNKENIDAGLSNLSTNVREKLHFYYYDTNEIIRGIKKGDRNLYPYYFCWQIGAYRLAKKICKSNKFDYCFALTFGSIWMPTFMYKLPIPFVWGPIGGGEAVPDEYLELMGKKSSILQRFRKIMIKTARFNPLVISPIKKAKYVIARTEDTAKLVPCKYSSKVKVCLETAIDLSEISAKDYNEDEKSDKKCRLIYTGRLIKLKGLDLVFAAISKCSCNNQIEFVLVGDGDQRNHLESLAKSLNIQDRITFIGKKSRSELLQILRDGDIYIFPSFKEGGSWALMEAMGCALPVICLDTSGMHIITDEKSAIRIPVGDSNNTVERYKNAIEKLENDVQLRQQMGVHARIRIEKAFNWDEKGEFLRLQILDGEDKKC